MMSATWKTNLTLRTRTSPSLSLAHAHIRDIKPRHFNSKHIQVRVFSQIMTRDLFNKPAYMREFAAKYSPCKSYGNNQQDATV